MPSIVSRLSAAALFTILLATACSESTGPTFTGPPPLPQEGSLDADIEFWLDYEGTGHGSNFAAALATIEAAHAATTIHSPFSKPIILGAQDLTPESQSDGYHWIYTVTDPAIIADVNVKGRVSSNINASWEARVSSASTNPPLTNFALLTGTAALNGLSGSWRVNSASNPATPTGLLDVAWEHDDAETWRVVFINIIAGSSTLGDYLEFQSSVDLRRVLYYDKSANIIVSVDWNTVNNAGSIISPLINGGARNCWNAAFQNVAVC